MKTALVLGGALSLHEDEISALAMGFKPDLIIATNHAGRDRPGRVDHWCSFHMELFPLWIKARAAAGHPRAGWLWSCHPAPAPKGLLIRKTANWKGSSGLLAVTVALELECSHIILCGVPMTREGEHYDKPGLWRDAGNYRKAWTDAVPKMAGRVRSFGGFTGEILGAPDPEWLAKDPAPQ